MSGQEHSSNEKDFLLHILEAVNRIEGYTANQTYVEFRTSTRDQDAVIRNFEVIGEARRNLEKYFPDFVAAHPELPIRLASDMSNALSHGYVGVDLAIVWQAIQRDLPLLKAKLLFILTALP